jgi:hypothetical protein
MYELYDIDDKLVFKGSKKKLIDKLLSLPEDQIYEVRRESDGEFIASDFPAQLCCQLD